VIVNTLSAYWGVHLAVRARRPALFYIHESTPPRSFFRGFVPPAALALVEDSLRRADRVSFLTATSQRYFAGLIGPERCAIQPGWIDLAGIDRFCSTHARATERTRLGLDPKKKLTINVGTVCDRKGQHIFARAVDLLWRHDPALAAENEFLLIGGGDTAYDRELADFLVELNRPNLRIIAGTREVYPYYRAADLFVCSSFEESFPRVLLEAMAFSVPILSTEVHGIPEIVRPEMEAVLVAPGDSAALNRGLIRLLREPAIGHRHAVQARARVESNFAAAILLPRHLAFAQAVQTAAAAHQ
jgi:glycosyltransferase involved in cell wall biosynthesis